MGENDVIISVYIDKTGGIPDTESFQLVKSFSVTAPNSNGDYILLTASDKSGTKVAFESDIETLVVVMEYKSLSSISKVSPSGYFNDKFISYLNNNADSDIPSDLFTYATGPCDQGIYSSVYSHHGQSVFSSDVSQWYVKVTGSSNNNNNNNHHHHNNDDSLSKQDIAGYKLYNIP